jgi:hypothetical protein
MARTRGRPGTCAYCNAHATSLEDEHVFPESWYPSTTPADAARIKVPSCSRCNRAYGRVEERLQRQWAACVDTTNPAADGVWDRVLRSLGPEHGRDPRDARVRAGNRRKLKGAIRPVPVSAPGLFPGFHAVEASWALQPSGVLALSAEAVEIDGKDVAAFTEKLVRGLHFRSHDAPLPANVVVKTYVVHHDTWPELLQQVRAMTPQGVPPGFIFWRGVAKDHPMFALWYFLIWGQVFLQASTVPPGVEQVVRTEGSSNP